MDDFWCHFAISYYHLPNMLFYSECLSNPIDLAIDFDRVLSSAISSIEYLSSDNRVLHMSSTKRNSQGIPNYFTNEALVLISIKSWRTGQSSKARKPLCCFVKFRSFSSSSPSSQLLPFHFLILLFFYSLQLTPLPG